MLTRSIFLPIAATIDGFQIAASAFFTAWGGTIGGAAGGCLIGAYVAGKTGCLVGATVGGFFGTFLNGTIGVAMGAMLGYIFSLCITFSFGVLLTVILLYSGSLNRKRKWAYVLLTFLFKIIPLLGLAPAWSRFVWVCTAGPTASENQSQAQTSYA